MNVWIDLSNSPHPLIFAPVARRLEELGHEVLVTARDHAQTAALARERWPGLEVIGRDSPSRRLGKVRASVARVRLLRLWARARRPDVGLSHNSYDQIVAATSLRIPVVTAMDFEHQPANHLAFRLANTILLPDVLPGSLVRRQGASAGKVRHYPGLKEELYLGDFEPEPEILARCGVERRNGTVVVVARTPPSRAAYHRFGNPLFVDVLRAVDAHPAARTVVLARHPEQHAELAALGLRNCVVPREALDSRSLMYAADLVIGAGGTMTREAALLGVPTVSIYAGAPPAVDRWLEGQGLLRRVRDIGELGSLQARTSAPVPVEQLRRRAATLIEGFVEAVLDAAAGRA